MSVALIATAVAVIAAAAALRPRRGRSPLTDDRRAATTNDDASIRVLEAVARELRSGATLAAAVRGALAEHPGCLVPVRESLARQASLLDALRCADVRRGTERVVVEAIKACHRAGGAMGDTIDRALMIVRERRAFALERRVHGAQAQISATVMTLVPLAFAAWSAATSERVRSVYAESPIAGALALVGLLLNGLGWWWMRRVVRGRAA